MIKYIISFYVILFFLPVYCENTDTNFPKDVHLDKLFQDKGKANFKINELIEIIEGKDKKYELKEYFDQGTEFEKLLFTVKKLQESVDKFQAIQLLYYALEFKLYRSEQEKHYISFMISRLFSYIKYPKLANNYLDDSIPQFLNQIENPEIKYKLYSQYANLLNKNDSIEKAAVAYVQVLKLAKIIKDSVQILKSQNNYGFISQRNKNLDTAIRYYRLNQDKRFKNIDPTIYAFSFGNFGSLCYDIKQYDSAIYYVQKELDLLNQIPSIEGIENSYLILGKSYIALNKIDSAKKYLKLTIQSSLIGKSIKTNEIATKLLIETISKDNNNVELKNFITDYFILNDSIKNSIYLESKEYEIKLNHFLKLIEESKNTKQNFEDLNEYNTMLRYTIITLAILLLFIVMIAIERSNSRKKMALSNERLNFRNKQLEDLIAQVSETNEKNSILLKELHHRVKNNLQVISSLFNLQVNSPNINAQTYSTLRDAQSRVHSISLVHKKMYQNEQVDHLDFKKYLTTLAKDIQDFHSNELDFEIIAEELFLNINVAVPLGLIFNELFTNSNKHAKQNELLKIKIELEKVGDRYRFIYTDNGVGVRLKDMEQFDDNSIGLTLISLLSQQLNAKIEYKEANQPEYGFWFSIESSFT
ncbi:MAG: hypothetical protein DWP98_01845 [Bacteroidetes bacterium]|nr:MAG: hypothetical protein DWP98_01845 [Bacteroidota bacterium]MBL1144954.1 hypothetical protein [Bacteroidota bacterium]NOG57748.1 hypothetical protein [Bacteroidota bacterium]